MSQLPPYASEALDGILSAFEGRQLKQASQDLSQRYRSKVPTRHLGASGSIAAYLAARLPATYAVNLAVLSEVARLAPDFAPISLLDLGAGPGTASLAAAQVFASLNQINLFEREADMIAAGQALLRQGPPLLAQANWLKSSLPPESLPAADLILVSYVLNELPPLARVRLGELLLEQSATLVLIEPGTPEGYAHLLALRQQALAAGWQIWAPCPHQDACPLAENDWCHFSRRLARSSLQRYLKQGSQSFEDEKYSYMVLARSPVQTVPARILRHPRIRKGLVELSLCGPSGLQSRIVPRSDPAYRSARKADWGEAWPKE
ncbi:MAG: rRNA methyltransferase [Candidatus Melainabacteria bacterium HGW-Melainabacteria-1]|nr:MAG: rRNA methyltransferase [Candidatus Melainabacteria bacterium HGW-Melainabacteria-1]